MLLTLDNIHKSFAGVHALRGVSFQLRAGEVHALVGENGAGKSTLIKIISGAHQPDSGSLEIAGEAIAVNDPVMSRALGVGIVYISHRLEEIYEIADRVTVLRDGKSVATCPIADVSRNELIRFMVGREVAMVFPEPAVLIGEILLETRNIGCAQTGV